VPCVFANCCFDRRRERSFGERWWCRGRMGAKYLGINRRIFSGPLDSAIGVFGLVVYSFVLTKNDPGSIPPTNLIILYPPRLPFPSPHS
jgi:hypothetical protein